MRMERGLARKSTAIWYLLLRSNIFCLIAEWKNPKYELPVYLSTLIFGNVIAREKFESNLDFIICLLYS
ncbi:hypothetical protein D3C73_1024400 [compost metagenome]